MSRVTAAARMKRGRRRSMPEQRQGATSGYDYPRARGDSKPNCSQKMRRSTYDSTLKRSDISNIDTIGTYNRTLSRSTRTSPGRWPNHPSHPRIVNNPTTMMPRPTMMMSWPSVLLPTIIVTVGTRGPLLDGPVEAGPSPSYQSSQCPEPRRPVSGSSTAATAGARRATAPPGSRIAPL
jgi:hypothetical protein